MRIDQAVGLAIKLLEKHNLSDWTLALDNHKTRFGECRNRTKTIIISRHLAEKHGAQETKDTLLHEIAHALLPANVYHDWRWKAKAKEIGARPCSHKTHKRTTK